MNPDRLLHCSALNCTNIIALGESIPSTQLVKAPQGRYCLDCAHHYGRIIQYTQAQADKLLERLLKSSGMLPGQLPPPQKRQKASAKGRKGADKLMVTWILTNGPSGTNEPPVEAVPIYNTFSFPFESPKPSTNESCDSARGVACE